MGLDHRPATFGCGRAARVVESGVGGGRWRSPEEEGRARGSKGKSGSRSSKQASMLVAAESRGGVAGPAVPSVLRRWRLAGVTVTVPVPCG